jgi:hypothetical protein
MGIDDANIYYVYMRNFMEGHGFVYSVGGERVEGFTSLLWTLIGSFAFKISGSKEWLLLIVNLGLMMASFTLIGNYFYKTSSLLKSEKEKFYASTFCILLILITPGYIDWTVTSLMETGLWSFLLTAIGLELLKYQNDKKRVIRNLSIYIPVLLLTRPEALLLAPFFVGILVIQEMMDGAHIFKAILANWKPVISYVVTCIGLFTFRLAYFGYPFPNTYYAKVSSERLENIASGISYLMNYFYNKPISIAVFGASVLLLIHLIMRLVKSKKLKKPTSTTELRNYGFFVLLFAMACFFPLFSGGDHFPFSRVMQPFTPFIALFTVLIAFKYIPNFNLIKVLFLTFVLFFTFNFNLVDCNLMNNSPMRTEFSMVKVLRESSEKMNNFFKNLEKLPSQGVGAAGATAYAYNGPSVDLLGLNNVEMAHASRAKNKTAMRNHQSFSKEVLFKQKPDLLWMSSGFTKKDTIKHQVIKNFSKEVYLQVYNEPMFKEIYGYYLIGKNGVEENLLIFARHQFIQSLDQQLYSFEVVSYE